MFKQGLVGITRVGTIRVRARVDESILKVFALNVIPHIAPRLVRELRAETTHILTRGLISNNVLNECCWVLRDS